MRLIRNKRAVSGAFRGADDGTRTRDLLHGNGERFAPQRRPVLLDARRATSAWAQCLAQHGHEIPLYHVQEAAGDALHHPQRGPRNCRGFPSRAAVRRAERSFRGVSCCFRRGDRTRQRLDLGAQPHPARSGQFRRRFFARVERDRGLRQSRRSFECPPIRQGTQAESEARVSRWERCLSWSSV
jgi:hypothetical protein